MSRIERIEGKRHAVTLLESIAGMPKAMVERCDVVQNLRRTISQRLGGGCAGGSGSGVRRAGMSDWAELKRLAEQVGREANWYAQSQAFEDFREAAGPDAILALIAENERLERKNTNQAETISQYQDHFEGGDSIVGLIAERDQLRAEVEALRKRAEYWTQRAKSAEGHLFTSDWRAARHALHMHTALASTPWDALTDAQQTQISSAAGAVIAEVNARRDSRKPVGCPEVEMLQRQVDTLTEWYANGLNVIAECSTVLPGTYYMDPPDGGDVAVPEQLRRMAKDAERYRWLRMADWWDSPICAIANPKQQAKLGSDCPSRDRLDDAIDAAMSKGGQGNG